MDSGGFKGFNESAMNTPITGNNPLASSSTEGLVNNPTDSKPVQASGPEFGPDEPGTKGAIQLSLGMSLVNDISELKDLPQKGIESLKNTTLDKNALLFYRFNNDNVKEYYFFSRLDGEVYTFNKNYLIKKLNNIDALRVITVAKEYHDKIKK